MEYPGYAGAVPLSPVPLRTVDADLSAGKVPRPRVNGGFAVEKEENIFGKSRFFGSSGAPGDGRHDTRGLVRHRGASGTALPLHFAPAGHPEGTRRDAADYDAVQRDVFCRRHEKYRLREGDEQVYGERLS